MRSLDRRACVSIGGRTAGAAPHKGAAPLSSDGRSGPCSSGAGIDPGCRRAVGPARGDYAGSVTSGRDDDALSWDGDDDPTLDVRTAGDEDSSVSGAHESAPAQPEVQPVPDPAADLPDGYTPVGKGSETYLSSVNRDARAETIGDEPDHTSSMGNAELISLGVLGGFSVLYAVGWLIGGLRLQGTAEFLVAPLAYQVSLWLAVAAPLVWYATALVLTRGRRLWVRFAWLIGGVVVLVPWPFIMVGAIGR